MWEAKSHTRPCQMCRHCCWSLELLPTLIIPRFWDFPAALSSTIDSEGAQLSTKMRQRHLEWARRGCTRSDLGSNTKQSSPNICLLPSADETWSDPCSWWGDAVRAATQRFGAAPSGWSSCCQPSVLVLREISHFWQHSSWQPLQHKWPFHSASAMSFCSVLLGEQKQGKNHLFSTSIRSVRRWPSSHHLWQQLWKIEAILQTLHCQYLSLTFILSWVETHSKAAKCV